MATSSSTVIDWDTGGLGFTDRCGTTLGDIEAGDFKSQIASLSPQPGWAT
jgi:hypothetical protein